MPGRKPDRSLTTTEHALLGMLARHGECSGYELLRQARESIGFFWSPARSHVYEVLPRLEQSGLARRRVVGQHGKPDKHLWRLTWCGRRVLARWIDAEERDPLGNPSIVLLKLFFGDYGDPESLVALVERFGDQARRQLAMLRAVDTEAIFVAPEELPRLTLRYGLTEIEAQLRWAETSLPELRARLPANQPQRATHR
jgi:PadR family transcriptional regulator AphA